MSVVDSKQIQEIDNLFYLFSCPHCDGPVIVRKTEMFCKVFRHAVLKKSNEQVNPHLPLDMCEDLFKKGLVYGCCKPFTVDVDADKVEKCDYI